MQKQLAHPAQQHRQHMTFGRIWRMGYAAVVWSWTDIGPDHLEEPQQGRCFCRQLAFCIHASGVRICDTSCSVCEACGHGCSSFLVALVIFDVLVFAATLIVPVRLVRVVVVRGEGSARRVVTWLELASRLHFAEDICER